MNSIEDGSWGTGLAAGIQAPAMQAAPINADLSDAGNADRFAAQHGSDVRYVQGLGWMAWGGTHWERGELAVIPRMVATARSIHQEAATCRDPDGQKNIAKWAVSSQMSRNINAALSLARPLVLAAPSLFDAQHMLLPAGNGTIDLRTGDMLPHSREDYATKRAPLDYDVASRCPVWDAFLARIMPDEAMRKFLQRAFGYSLTGSVIEQVLFFLHGRGANGKSVLVEVLRELLGDYAGALDAESIMINDRGASTGTLAGLVSARVATVPETPEGGRLNEVRIKEITGADTIAARFLYQEPFTYKPQFKLWIRGNHKPQIRGTDDGIWRRFMLIHLPIQIPEAERDVDLQTKLRAELPGILAWAVRGAVEWCRAGLMPPESVRGAVAEYRNEMDTLGDFLDERCVIGEKYKCSHKSIFTAYQAWCEESGVRPLSSRRLGNTLAERDFVRDKTGGISSWGGVGLAVDGWD